MFLFAQDFTVFGGSLSGAFAEKICKVMDLAAKVGAPFIGLNDGAGARIQEGVVSLGGYGNVFLRNVLVSGVIPQISAIMGPCAGGAVYSPAMTDFIIMVKNTSNMFITGPDVVKTVTHEEVTTEQLGGAMAHASKSGVASHAAGSEQEAIHYIRQLLSFLPQNNLEDPPFVPTEDDAHRQEPALRTLVPDNANKPYDIKELIKLVVDDGVFLEVHSLWARNIVCGFARFGGRSVGIVANQPALPGGLPRHRLVEEGRPLRALLRRLQPADRDLRRRAGLPAGARPGARRHHHPRLEAALRLLRGDGAEGDGGDAQGLRRRLRRHEQQAHPRRRELRVPDGRVRGDGPGRRRQHRVPQRAAGRAPTRSRAGSSSRPTTARPSPTRGRRRSSATSTR